MKRETGLFNSKSPDGGWFFALLVLFLAIYTLASLPELMAAMDAKFGK